MTTTDENRERLAQLEGQSRRSSNRAIESIEKLQRVLKRLDDGHDSTRERGENTEAKVLRLETELKRHREVVAEIGDTLVNLLKETDQLEWALSQVGEYAGHPDYDPNPRD